MNKEDFINDIAQKLCLNIQLTPNEINTIISALRKTNHCYQKPYYEVIYHDKYGDTETRIMNPVDSRTTQMPSGEFVRDDHFDLRFRRFVPRDDIDTEALIHNHTLW